MTMSSHQATPVCAYGGDVDGLGATEYFSNHTNAEPTHQLQHAYYGTTSYDAPSYTHQHSYDHSYDSTFQEEADQSTTTTSSSPYIKHKILPNVFSLAQKLIPAVLRSDKKKTLDCYDDGFEGLCSLGSSTSRTWNTSYSTTQEINSNSTWLEYENNHNRDTSYYGSADNVEVVEGGGTMAWGSNNDNYGATKTDLQRTPSVELPVGYLSVIGSLPSLAGAYKKNESGNGLVLVGSRPMIRMNTFEKKQQIHKGMSSNDNPQDGTACAVATNSNSTSQHDLENVDISQTEDACDEVPIIGSPLQSSASLLESPTDGSQPFYNVLFGIGDDDSSDTNLEETAPLPESQAEEAQSFHDVLFGLGEDCESTTQTSLQATSTDETSQPFWAEVWTHVIARVAYWRK